MSGDHHDMTCAYPLLNRFEPDSLLTCGLRSSMTAAQFLAKAHTLADRLPAKQYVLNLCQDRGLFLVGFAAALLAGRITLLPFSCLGEALRGVARSYPDLCCLTDYADGPAGVPAVSMLHEIHAPATGMVVPSIPATQIAVVAFTSGSTAQPTAHAKTWESLVLGAETLGRHIGLGPGPARAFLGTVPPQHMYGLETTVLLPLQWGGMVHVERPVLPADLRSELARLPYPRWVVTTPLHLRACLEERMTLPAVEGIISATMPLLPSLAKEGETLWGVPIHEIYGCTEGGMVAMRRTAACETWTVCEGLRIWSREGDVWVQGGHVAEPLLLADRISVLTEREFLLHGRANDLVKIGGKRASLQALNAELNRITGVRDGAFYAPEAQTGGERLKAFVVAAEGLTVSAILAELRKRIDPVFLPRPLYLVEELPRSVTGKLPHESLRTLAASRFPKSFQPASAHRASRLSRQNQP